MSEEEDFSSFNCDDCGKLIAYIENYGMYAGMYHGSELCPTCYKKKFDKELKKNNEQKIR